MEPEAEVGKKYDAGKTEWHLLPWDALEQIVRVLMFGKKQYGENNWRLVENWNVRYYNALIRHVTAWRAGQMYDPETKIHHLAHAGCCVLFLLALSLEREPKPSVG